MLKRWIAEDVRGDAAEFKLAAGVALAQRLRPRCNRPELLRQAFDGRRGQLDKMFSLRRYGPDKVANAIVSAVKKNKPIRPVTFEAYALYGVSRVLPQALRSTARVRVI